MSNSTIPETDFTLLTDGSGWEDGFGGWAALVKHNKTDLRDFRMGCMSGTSVDRMEMTAMIEGLHMTLQLARRNTALIRHLGSKPSVVWYSDRESMVNSALGRNERSNATDIWNQYSFFEEHLIIYPVFIARESDVPDFKFVDLHASTGRIIIKNYMESIQ